MYNYSYEDIFDDSEDYVEDTIMDYDISDIIED